MRFQGLLLALRDAQEVSAFYFDKNSRVEELFKPVDITAMPRDGGQ